MKEQSVKDALVIFLQSEAEDESRKDKVLSKAVGNITWLAKKLDRNKITLHSFAHLSGSKSSPEFAEEVMRNIKDKLENKGYETLVTPFGYFLEFKIHVKGESLAKVFKSL